MKKSKNDCDEIMLIKHFSEPKEKVKQLSD